MIPNGECGSLMEHCSSTYISGASYDTCANHCPSYVQDYELAMVASPIAPGNVADRSLSLGYMMVTIEQI